MQSVSLLSSLLQYLYNFNLHQFDGVVCDINYPSNTKGFLAHTLSEFTFIGPVRQPSCRNELQTNIDIALAVQNTGAPNFLLLDCQFNEI